MMDVTHQFHNQTGTDCHTSNTAGSCNLI